MVDDFDADSLAKLDLGAGSVGRSGWKLRGKLARDESGREKLQRAEDCRAKSLDGRLCTVTRRLANLLLWPAPAWGARPPSQANI